MEKIKVMCEMEVTIKMIGGKCKPLILYYLINSGTKRFNELLSYITLVSQKTLTNQLRELEADGLVSRKAYAVIPPKVEYSITEKGATLEPVLKAMCAWGFQNIDDRFEMVKPVCSKNVEK